MNRSSEESESKDELFTKEWWSKLSPWKKVGVILAGIILVPITIIVFYFFADGSFSPDFSEKWSTISLKQKIYRVIFILVILILAVGGNRYFNMGITAEGSRKLFSYRKNSFF